MKLEQAHHPLAVKFTDSEWQRLKIILAIEKSCKYKYELFSKMINHYHKDLMNADNKVALATPLNGRVYTCYIENNNALNLLNEIASELNCKLTTALYTVVVKYQTDKECQAVV